MQRLFCTLATLVMALIVTQIQAAPQIESWRTTNGAKVLYAHAPELPMVDIRVVFDAGSARDGDYPGLGLLTNGLLAEGAAGLSANEISRRFDAVGANFSNSSLRDMSLFSLRTLTETPLLEQAVNTMAAVLTEPEFPQRALERERKHMELSLKHDLESPGEIASKRYYAELYGDHPYASPSGGTFESLPELTRERIVAHYKRLYVGANAVVAIVGAVDREQAESLAEQVVGKLPEGKAVAPLPEPQPLEGASSTYIEHPSTQTHILVGQLGMRRGDPDYFALYLGNHILGGSGLVSRISEEIREKRGLAYSSYSYFAPMRAMGPFTMGLQTANKNRGQALAVLKETLQEYLDEGPSEEELEAAKRNITGGFPLKVDSNSDIVEYLAMIGFYDLELDYLDRFNGRIEALTREQVVDALRRRIHPGRMLTITVGGEG